MNRVFIFFCFVVALAAAAECATNGRARPAGSRGEERFRADDVRALSPCVRIVSRRRGGIFRAAEGIAGKSRGGGGMEAVLRRGHRSVFLGKPERVEVLDSGTLAFSSGARSRSAGAADRHASIPSGAARRTAAWKNVFDKGCPPCECPPKP